MLRKFALVIIILISGTQAKTYYVSTGGNNSNNGSEGSPWKTINHSVSDQSPVSGGDTILVKPGKYTEAVYFKKAGGNNNPIYLIAEGDVTVFDHHGFVCWRFGRLVCYRFALRCDSPDLSAGCAVVLGD